MRCKLNLKGACGGARSLRKEGEYLSQRSHWSTIAGLHNIVRHLGNAPPITPEQVRENQIAVVLKNNRREIAQFCRPQDTALREALAVYEREAAQELPSA